MAAILLLCLLVFFRDALLSRFVLLYGDSYDGGIEVSLLNHWYNVFVHGARWNLTGWFAPQDDTIGYNDTDIIPGIPFTIARLAGADPFLAAFVSHVAMKVVGFAGMYALLRRGLAIRTPLALAGAAIFATSNASLLHMHHAQLLTVGLVPWLMLAAIGTVRAAIADAPPALWRNGLAFAILFGVAALNAFYMVWFFALFAMLFVPIGLAVADAATRTMLWRAARRHGWRIAGVAAATIVALVPFLLVYLPKLAESGGHDFLRDVMRYLPIRDTFVNVGPGNLVWGQILPNARFSPGEHRFGFPLGLLVGTLIAIRWSARHQRAAPLMLAIALTTTVLALLAIRWSIMGSLWWLVYEVVPGVRSVRVITRLLLFLLIPMIALLMMALQRWRLPPAVLAIAIAFLLLEEVQLAAPLALDRPALLRMLRDIGPPPADCDTFFVVSARPADAPLQAEADQIGTAWGASRPNDLLGLYRHNVDAMLLASYYDRPTINGVSTFNPPDWKFDHPEAADYTARVRRYAKVHHLGQLCGLDRRRTPRWFALR
ncbi:hypothetical protein U1872_02055 [Sphingomonas sp. RB3P16]|uniref:hypothetical protein n=1 Tax=Parasphingomonas frigoris TaxID=3096163 RepID=UPI002FCA1552